jgi:bifunctional DNase/RNase
MQLEMTVAGLTLDPSTNAPIVILREKDGERMLPIWIGPLEASAIAFELEGVKLGRPLTHDLLRASVEALGGHIERVTVSDLRENTYFAVIAVSQAGRTLELDSRPSDALALALRAHAPIFCEEHVIRLAQSLRQPEAAGPAASGRTGEEDVDRGEDGPKPIVAGADQPEQELLESLDPAAFGKYKM